MMPKIETEVGKVGKLSVIWSGEDFCGAFLVKPNSGNLIDEVVLHWQQPWEYFDAERFDRWSLSRRCVLANSTTMTRLSVYIVLSVEWCNFSTIIIQKTLMPDKKSFFFYLGKNSTIAVFWSAVGMRVDVLFSFMEVC